jgi:hypothetical protein
MNDLVVVEKPAEWDRLKQLVLDSVSSPITKRVYSMALDEFLAWFKQAPRPGFTKAAVSAWRVSLEERKLGSSSIIVRILAIRKLAAEGADNGILAPELAAGIARVKSAKSVGIRMGNWLSARQAQALINAPDVTTLRGLRNRDHRCAPGMRPPALRGGRAHIRAHSAAGWPLVHRGSVGQAWTHPNDTDAELSEGRDRCMDCASRNCRRPRLPPRHSRRPGIG